MGHSDEGIKYDSHQINGLSLANIMSGRSQTPKVTLTILVTYVQSSRVCRGRTRGCQGLGTRKENDCLTGRGFPLGATEVLELSVNELYTCIHLSSVLEGWHVKGPGVQTQQ